MIKIMIIIMSIMVIQTSITLILAIILMLMITRYKSYARYSSTDTILQDVIPSRPGIIRTSCS